jgi:hypothetical protein
MTREQLEKRKAELIASLEQQKANIHATDGAIQEVNFWLSKLDAAEVKPEIPVEKKK